MYLWGVGYDRKTKTSVYTIDVTPAPWGWSHGALNVVLYAELLGNGRSKLYVDQGQMESKMLQGGLLFENPDSFGGLLPDGTVTSGIYGYSTTMPNSNTPVVDYVYSPYGIINSGNSCFYKIVSVINNVEIIVEDPLQTAASCIGYVLHGLSSLYNTPTYLDIDVQLGYDFDMWCSDGTYTPFIPYPVIIDGAGSPIAPILLSSSTSAKLTVKR